MQTNNADWLHYQLLLKKSAAHLSKNDDIASLLKLSQQLTSARLALAYNSVSLLQEQTNLPAIVQKIELVLLLCRHYNWPKPVCRLLLQGAFCSALSQIMPQLQQWPNLLPFPALGAARLLQLNGQNSLLLTLLTGCYPTERKIASGLQNPLSLVLTQAEYLSTNTDQGNTNDNTNGGSTNRDSAKGDGAELLLARIGTRIALTKSEYELTLLRHTLSYLTVPVKTDMLDLAEVGTSHTDLLKLAYVNQLFNADNKEILAHLRQSAALAAPVLARASQLNRLQQQVVDLHLAINLVGRMQLPHILADAELQANLAQLHHPHQLVLQQFSHILAQALHLLLPDNEHGIAYWHTLSLCISAPLWLDNTAYASALLARTNTGFSLRIIDHSYQKDSTLELILNLLQQYQLNEWQYPVRCWLKPQASASSDKHGLALQLAWHTSVTLLTNQSPANLPHLLHSAQQAKLIKHDMPNWLMQLASDCQCYCPLQLAL